MKFLLLILIIGISGCATTHSLVRVEKVGPVEAEIWRNNKTKTCERRVYLDSLYYKTDVECPLKFDDVPIH